MNLSEKFDRIYNKISTESFLTMKALMGKVPFFITSYDIKYQEDVYAEIKRLKSKLSECGIKSESINLYDLSIQILKDGKILHKLFEKEFGFKKKRVLQILNAALDAESKIAPEIEKIINLSNAKVAFLYGIAEVYPFMRSHIILSNLESKIKKMPLIMFYPGEFNGGNLHLFDLFKSDNYYRAFNLNDLIKDVP